VIEHTVTIGRRDAREQMPQRDLVTFGRFVENQAERGASAARV
jgi:hypothetical protein